MPKRYFDLPASLTALAARSFGAVLLESSRPDDEERDSFLFHDPVTVLELTRLEDAPHFFR